MGSELQLLQGLLSKRNEHRILGLMLILLHFALWGNFGGPLSRSLMLAHLGLFLIWQPFWSRDQRLAPRSSLIFVFATLAFVWWLNWWVMAFWLLVLTGLVGGRITYGRSERYAYLTTLLFLVCELLIGCIPSMFEVRALAEEVPTVFGYGLLLLPVGLFFIPSYDRDGHPTQAVDFLYGLTMSMLASILALGSLLSMYTTGSDYAVALFQTVLGIALFLLVISWLWMPLAGFSGLGQLWERYLLNIGTPFEHWLGRLARLARRRQTPDEFLEGAMLQFVELPWVAGVEWREGESQPPQSKGEPTLNSFRVRFGEVHGVVYAWRPVGAALLLHGKLLMQLVGHFHRAKIRERQLTEHAHIQAIYETGARVTHDIKNLLQSMHTISVALQQSGEDRRADVQLLLQRQLPHLTQRLQQALNKLQAPEEPMPDLGLLRDWWEEFRARNEDGRIRFQARVTGDPRIPGDFLDSTLENLLDNARIKRQMAPGVEISVDLEAGDGQVRLRVCDTGTPVPPEVERLLFRSPVKSRSGLGIGLYQSAKQAESLGYRLELTQNTADRVCFSLSGPAAALEKPEATVPVVDGSTQGTGQKN